MPIVLQSLTLKVKVTVKGQRFTDSKKNSFSTVHAKIFGQDQGQRSRSNNGRKLTIFQSTVTTSILIVETSNKDQNVRLNKL